MLRITVGARSDQRRDNVAGLVPTRLGRARIACRTKTQGPAAHQSAVRLPKLRALGLDYPLFTAIGEILLARTFEEI